MMMIFLAAVLIIIAAPVFTIEALNTLFSLGIPLNAYTWLSAFWLQTFVIAANSSRGSKS